MRAQTRSKHNTQSGNSYFYRLIGFVACLGAAVSVIVVVLNMLDMGIILSSKPILIALLIDAALVAFPFYLVVSGKNDYSNLTRIGCVALAGLMICLNFFASSTLGLTTNFLNEQFADGTSGTVEYSVIAQRSAGIELSAQNTVRAGIQDSDLGKDEAKQATQELADASFTEYGNISELIKATENENLDIAVVQSAMLSAYQEYFPESYNKLDVLATFKAGSDTAQEDPASAHVDITKPFVIYVSGADVSGDIDQAARSDVNMLVLIDPENYKMLLISTPRDFYVQLHGTTGLKDKLSHSGIYGIDMSEQTIEDFYDMEVNYHVRINFDTLINLVDSMGGIVVYNPVAFNHWQEGYAEGEIYLDGYHALMFARTRKEIPGGDYARGENQQRVIEGIVDRITSPHVVTHYTGILEALSGTFRSNVPKEIIAQLFSRQISLGGDWTIEKMSPSGTPAPTLMPTYSLGSDPDNLVEVEIPDEVSVQEIRDAIDVFLNGGA